MKQQNIMWDRLHKVIFGTRPTCTHIGTVSAEVHNTAGWYNTLSYRLPKNVCNRSIKTGSVVNRKVTSLVILVFCIIHIKGIFII